METFANICLAISLICLTVMAIFWAIWVVTTTSKWVKKWIAGIVLDTVRDVLKGAMQSARSDVARESSAIKLFVADVNNKPS